MKVSDYIVEYLIEKGITDVFGYPGGMITHLILNIHKNSADHNNTHGKGPHLYNFQTVKKLL